MGVLACDRKGCENIMCDSISHERNEYLCWECKSELKNVGFTNIDTFMESDKPSYEDNSAWEEYVDKVFVSRYEGDW